MTDLNKIENYIKLLDNFIKKSDEMSDFVSPTRHTSPELPVSSGLKLSKSNNYDEYSQNHLILFHSFCHLFKDTGAVGMTINDIKKAHDEIVLKLESHQKFDSLDEEKNE